MLCEIAASGSLLGRKPNIVFVLTDDQGYGDMSCHGHPILKTPSMDRLHDEGVRFTDFHVSPTCSPTRSALMTGRHEFKNGVTHTILERERLTPSAITLAQVLRSAGYATGIFGKWHLGDEPDRWPSRRGFDEMFIHGGGGIGQTYPGSCGDAPGNTYFNPVILHNGVFENTQGYCTDVFFREALRWMDAARGRRPFFAFISCNAPHAPLQVRPEDEARYAGRHGNTNAVKFMGMVANIDDNLGILLARLKEWNLERETLVIFMNDNGTDGGAFVYNAGMRGKKGSAFLGGTRAASFWRWPGTLQPADCGALAAHMDVLPTLMEIAGATNSPALQAQVEGRSLRLLLEDPAAAWPDRELFTHFGRWARFASPDTAKYRACGVRSARWHLVSETGAERPEWMLFDVPADPGEQRDVSGQHPDVVAGMTGAFERWWTSVQPHLVNERAEGPPVNPFKEIFWKQRGGGPSEEDRRLMDPKQNPATATPGANGRKEPSALPTQHELRNIEGWTVRVDRRLTEGAESALGDRALKLIAARLVAIEAVMPAPALEKLRRCGIQIDLSHGALWNMQYHPGAGWLTNHGYSAALEKWVHIPDARRFLSPYENHRQPWALLHELAHAFHDQFLGFENRRVQEAWERFRSHPQYQSVLTSPGGMREHYALTNAKEFFAEMTECYFGSNDFFPFVAGELKKEEPDVFALMKELWGPLPSPEAR
ncbi:MAG: sulfatase-like hydrolase/transferase [Verrucomicrobia bacterium]|nr:sulfatase-like hydrolase/transferase [Verrucomicrobiota bacterium]